MIQIEISYNLFKLLKHCLHDLSILSMNSNIHMGIQYTYLSLSLISSSVLLAEGDGKSISAAIRCMINLAASSPLWGSKTPYKHLQDKSLIQN